VAVHGQTDSPDLRTQLGSMFKAGTPPVQVSQRSTA
jgi:hypothetical protein